MSNQSEADRTQQATVWPPPPDVPFVEWTADPHREESLSTRRYLTKAIFLFVGGCLFQFLGYLLSATFRLPTPFMLIIGGLHYLWPILYIVAAYLGLRAILLARPAKQSGLQVQSFIIIALNVLFAFMSLFLLSI